MFESLSRSLEKIFTGLKKRGMLSQEDIDLACAEIRRTLLEADVAVSAVAAFFARFAPRAEDLSESLSPGEALGEQAEQTLATLLGSPVARPFASIQPSGALPPAILLLGLQGSGKTTTAAKLALHLKQQGKKPLLVSLDFSRPSAEEQLATLARRAELPSLEQSGDSPLGCARYAQRLAKSQEAILICDSAGRMQVDELAMEEIAALANLLAPIETLLVADAMLGQEAVRIAQAFNQATPLSGIVLTRLEGDARGGAALSMLHATGKPIVFAGTGEGLAALEPFDAKALAKRLMGQGDLAGLVKKLQPSKTEDMPRGFDLNTMLDQITRLQKVGGLESLARHLPQSMRKALNSERAKSTADAEKLKKQERIIKSMTAQERRNPKILHASRKKRIAAGASVTVSEVNRLLKNHAMAAKTMKTLARMDEKMLQRHGLPRTLP